jgi:hypothetical protein
MKKPEQILRDQVTRYLKLQYPEVLYKVDLESDFKLSIQAGRRNKQLQKSRGWPDLFIAHPSTGFSGMFLELKVETPYLKDGKTLKSSEHLKEQSEMIWQLRRRGYYADFGVGFEDCKKQIDAYLNSKKV